jgi:hypothetical protein
MLCEVTRMYFRVAFRTEASETVTDQAVLWRWRSTLLTSPHALFTLLRVYQTVPREHIRVFFTSSEDEMERMLARQNEGLLTCSLTAEQLLINRSINMQEVHRLELELSDLSASDEPYRFTLPSAWRELQTWISLMERVQMGELEP